MIHVAMAHQSARSRELTERLRATVADYRLREPKMTEAEVAMAVSALRPPRAGETRKAVGVIAAIIGAFVAVALTVSAEGGRGAERTPLPPGVYIGLGVALAAVILGVALFKRSD